MEGLEKEFRASQQQLAEQEVDSKLRQAKERLQAVKRHNARLQDIQRRLDALPPARPRPAVELRPGDAGEGERVVLLLDRDNRGQKFLDGLCLLPATWTVHVVYNPHSKHAFPAKPAGDIRFHPSKTNDKECNAAVLAFVAGQVASEEDPKSTFVYLVFCDEHGRHEEVIENLRADGFAVETCSSYQYTVADVLQWHDLDPEEYTGSASAQADFRYSAAGTAIARAPASPTLPYERAESGPTEPPGRAPWMSAQLNAGRAPPRYGPRR